jgi:hypothetical protein
MNPIPAFLVGGYFHTAILEPEKLKNFRIVEATTRNTKAYREISNGELCLLQHEVDKTELLVDTMMSNEICLDLIQGNNIEYEVNYRYSKHRILLRYSPDMKKIFIVDGFTGELTPIKLLNKQENAHIKRQKVCLTGGENYGLY